MVSEMIVTSLKNAIGEHIIFFIGTFRYEGIIKDCDNDYLKYYDTHKERVLYKRLTEISEWEVLE